MTHLEGLNERQKTAVLKTKGPLLVVAGAGAGKTTTITHRIAHLIAEGVQGHKILAVTFTNKAAREMRGRVQKLLASHTGSLPLLTTFHALGARLLREFHVEAEVPKGFVIWDRDDSVKALKRIGESLDLGDINPRGALSVISRQKGDGVGTAEYAGTTKSFRERGIARMWEAYEKALTDQGALDFDDLLAKTLVLLEKQPHVLSRLQNRWTHITVDEYQDTNRVQFEITRFLVGDARNLCVVGDTDQCIFSWRNADPGLLLSFEQHFPGAAVVLLEQNYRSTRTILSAANAIIAKNVRRKEKNLFTDNETGEPIALYGAMNEMDEAWYVGQSIMKLVEAGTRPGEIAVLYRENFQSRALEEALLRFGIPYRVLGTRFFERAEIKDVLSYIRAALNPKSKVDIARIISTPPRGIGKTTLEKMLSGEPLAGALALKVQKFRDSLAKIKHAAQTLPASDAVRFAVEESGIEKMLSARGGSASGGKDDDENRERLGNVGELINLAVRYDDAASPEGIERLMEEAALESEQDSLDESSGAVSLMTAHASKGLEFEAVFVTGLEQGLFPSLRESADRDEEEERRLFYVAVTRAKKRLFLSYTSGRMKYGSREPALASEFLDDIDQRLVQQVRAKHSLLDDMPIIE
ncbi:UvrD-helicase domain-containing protein [Candidatus Kaiserbacteria bacterium]|nr:UvrD-helicase domain-containing protein [Candidatus Kaiserbacteria bacterium]